MHKLLLPLLVTAIFVVGIWVLVSSKNTQTNRTSAADFTNTFVTRSGTKFYLGPQEFSFVGFNLFDAAGAGNSPYSCPGQNGWWQKYTDEELDAALKAMKTESGSTVLRFWAFQKYTNGGLDFTGIDKVIRIAKANGLKVIPTLENGPGHCTEPGGGKGASGSAKWEYQGDTWYTEGYKVINPGNKLSYRDYVRTIVSRYKGEPAIFGWMMVNEADTSKKVDGKSALYNFANDIGTLIKSIDTNHLVTVGTQSNGASGATGQDFLDVYGLPSIDFTEGHDWAYWGSDTEPLPGSTRNADGSITLPDPRSATCLKTYQGKIGCSVVQSVQILKKPFVMGEVGIAVVDKDTASYQRRAQLIDAKMKAFFDAGGAGYLYWQWNKVLDGERFDVRINNNDPLLPVMKKYAGISLSTSMPTVKPTTTSTSSPTVKPTITPAPTVIPTKTPTPTVSPTRTPVATSTSKPTPSATPTLKPTMTPKPTVTPTPSQPPTNATSVLQAENMVVATGKSTIVSESGVSSLLLLTNATARGTIQGPIQTLTIRTKAASCLGDPHINVKVNGNYVYDRNISGGYTDYTTNNLAYLKLGAGTHTVEVIYNNDASFWFCDRNIYIDKISAY